MKRGSVKNRYLDRYVGIPVLLATSVLQPRRPRPRRIARIGVMASPTLGDTLLNSAAVQDLRREFPHARIFYFASPTSVAAVQLLPGVDEIVRLELTKPWIALPAIRKCHLDVLFDFTPWQRLTAFYTALSGAKYRVGFRSTRQYRHWTYDLTAEHSHTLHELENFRNLLRVFGTEPKEEPSLEWSRLRDGSLQETGRMIVFHPWASGDRGFLREWPVERWIELASRLHSPDTIFVITGGPSERTKSETLSAKLKQAGLNAKPYPGRDGLHSVAAILQKSALVVSVNTGIMHLAAISGAPTVGLNGPTASHRWGPRGARVASVEPRGGGGFLHFGFEYDGNPTDCMDRITVDDVYQTALELCPALAKPMKYRYAVNG
jgi:heptosyltransferase-3